MKSNRRLVLVLFLSFIVNASAGCRILNFKIEEIFTIGGPDVNNEEYLFIAPQEASTDSSGNIYVRDVTTTYGYHSQCIKKFSPSGKYILTIGRRGKGPGEFLRILSFCVDQKNRILTFDEINRRYSVFSADSKLLKDCRFSKQGYTSLHAIRPFGKNKLLISHNESPEYKISNTFTVFTHDLKKSAFSFGHKKDFQNSLDPLFMKIFNSDRIPFAMIDTTKLLGSNRYYNGYATFMQKKDNTWTSREVNAHKIKYKTLEPIPEKFVKSHNFSAYKHDPGLIISSGYQGKVYGYIIRNFTPGIFLFQKDKFIQFILFLKSKDLFEFGFNLFSDKGLFLGYQKIKTFKDNPSLADFKVIGTDNNCGYFVVTAIDDCPVIQKIKIIGHQ